MGRTKRTAYLTQLPAQCTFVLKGMIMHPAMITSQHQGEEPYWGPKAFSIAKVLIFICDKMTFHHISKLLCRGPEVVIELHVEKCRVNAPHPVWSTNLSASTALTANA